jgi:hypothetical protein
VRWTPGPSSRTPGRGSAGLAGPGTRVGAGVPFLLRPNPALPLAPVEWGKGKGQGRGEVPGRCELPAQATSWSVGVGGGSWKCVICAVRALFPLPGCWVMGRRAESRKPTLVC